MRGFMHSWHFNSRLVSVRCRVRPAAVTGGRCTTEQEYFLDSDRYFGVLRNWELVLYAGEVFCQHILPEFNHCEIFVLFQTRTTPCNEVFLSSQMSAMLRKWNVWASASAQMWKRGSSSSQCQFQHLLRRCLPFLALPCCSRLNSLDYIQLLCKSTIPWIALNEWMALNSLICADVLLRNCSVTRSAQLWKEVSSLSVPVSYTVHALLCDLIHIFMHNKMSTVINSNCMLPTIILTQYARHSEQPSDAHWVLQQVD